jgi:hypothetical protein
MANKYVNTTQWQKDLFKRTEGYAANVRKLYESNLTEIIDLVKGTELEDGLPFSFADYGYEDQVNKILRKLYASVYKEIRGDSSQEWQLAELNNDSLVESIFGTNVLSNNHFRQYFGRNKEAMDAFLERKSGKDGLNLSQRVWDYTNQHKTNLEDSLDLAIGEGTPANSLATKITQYLREPDRVYKRFRIRIGTGKDGKAVYGTILKRRTFDKSTGIYKWVNEAKSAYKPGTGVYRSSYRNAQRLARTETNIAYRTADYNRFQDLDFIIGVEIKLSNNHPILDICNDLQGVYPKTFKWTGWHSNCRCYMVPVMATQDQIDEMADRILDGESIDIATQIKDYPGVFKTWVKDNEDRYMAAKNKGTLPYFIMDNQTAINKILKPLTPEQQHYQDLVDKYGEDAVNGLYQAFDKFKAHISGGDLPYQIKKLKFEKQWVIDKKKYSTYQEMANMIQQELDVVEEKYNLEQAIQAAKPILGFTSKSKQLNSIIAQIKDNISNGGTAKQINDLTAKATDKIKEIEKARLKAKSSIAPGSIIDIFATKEEKLEIARLQDEFDKLFANSNSIRDFHTGIAYTELAEYKKKLAIKYISHQGALNKLNGETAEIQSKAIDEYLNSPVDHSACSPVGGKFQDLCSDILKQKIKDFSSLTGISEDELGLVARYTSGSKWCNWYGYGVVDTFTGVVRDYGGLCQKFYPAFNGVLEKMPRFEGISFSGIDMDIAKRTKFINELKDCMKNGKPYVNKAFLSTTTDVSTTDIFGTDIIYVIKGTKGAIVTPVSAYPSENEVVFRHHTKFKINKVYQEGAKPKYGRRKGTWVIEMEEI